MRLCGRKAGRGAGGVIGAVDRDDEWGVVLLKECEDGVVGCGECVGGAGVENVVGAVSAWEGVMSGESGGVC